MLNTITFLSSIICKQYSFFLFIAYAEIFLDAVAELRTDIFRSGLYEAEYSLVTGSDGEETTIDLQSASCQYQMEHEL